MFSYRNYFIMADKYISSPETLVFMFTQLQEKYKDILGKCNRSTLSILSEEKTLKGALTDVSIKENRRLLSGYTAYNSPFGGP